MPPPGPLFCANAIVALSATLAKIANVLIWSFLLFGVFLFACIGKPPDGLVAVIGEVQRSIFCHNYGHGPAPCVAVGRDKSGDEVFIHSTGMAVVQRNADDFITRAPRTIPRSVLGGEQIAVIFLGE